MSEHRTNKPQGLAAESGNLEIRGKKVATRRQVLKASAFGAAAQVTSSTWMESARAQNTAAADPDLARLRERRRTLIKGGVVLSLDRQVGDFAEADVLIEAGKIREVRPNIAASDDMAIVDAANRVVIPGFIDTHNHTYQGLLRGTLANGLLREPLLLAKWRSGTLPEAVTTSTELSISWSCGSRLAGSFALA
jgi:hypothetical protein